MTTRDLKCPYCSSPYVKRQALADHIVLKHLIPQIVFDFAEFLIDSHGKKKRKVTFNVKARIM